MSGPRGSGQYLGEEGHGGHGHNGRRESDRDGEHGMDTLGLGKSKRHSNCDSSTVLYFVCKR